MTVPPRSNPALTPASWAGWPTAPTDWRRLLGDEAVAADLAADEALQARQLRAAHPELAAWPDPPLLAAWAASGREVRGRLRQLPEGRGPWFLAYLIARERGITAPSPAAWYRALVPILDAAVGAWRTPEG